jgi:hypothetical protein
LRIECSCPDWDEPCKHAVAVLLELAERVGDDPGLLLTWRAGSPDDWPATPAETPTPTPTGPDTPGDAPLDPFFAGGSALREAPAPLGLFPAVGRGRLMVGDVDLGAIIDDATATAAAGPG